MAGDVKTIGDLITVIRDEGDNDQHYSEAISNSIDRLTEVVTTFGRFMRIQSVILDRFVKQSDNYIKEMIEDLKRAREVDAVKRTPVVQPNTFGRSDGGSSGGSTRADKGSSVFSKIFGGLGTLATTLLSPLTKGLTEAFSLIASPLMGLGRLFLRSGPIGLVIFSMYEIFKDISENPIFTDTIDSIRTTFDERIVPTFNRIVKSISALIGPGTMIGDWFNNFRIQIQDFVLQTLSNLTITVTGVLEGVDLLLQGDWMSGISTIVKSLFDGVINLFDSALTNVLEMFGVEFGEGGSLFGVIGESIANLSAMILQGWDTLATFVSDVWSGITTTVTNAFNSIVGAISTSIQTTIDAFTQGGVLSGAMTAMTEYFSLMVAKPLDLIKDLAAWVADQFGFDKAAEWLKSFSLDEAFRSFADFLTGIPQMLIDYAQEMWIDIWSKFKKGLVNLGAWISSIPDRIYLNAIEYLNNTSGVGYLIDDDAVAAAQQAVAQSDASTADKLKQIDLEAGKQRAAVELQRAALDKSTATIAQKNSELYVSRVNQSQLASDANTRSGSTFAPTNIKGGTNVATTTNNITNVINNHSALDRSPYLIGPQ